jgi:hypothetical protein
MTEPAPLPRHLIRSLAAQSQGIVVMTKCAARVLEGVYQIPTDRVRVIPLQELKERTVEVHSSRVMFPHRMPLCGRCRLLFTTRRDPMQCSITVDGSEARLQNCIISIETRKIYLFSTYISIYYSPLIIKLT